MSKVHSPDHDILDLIRQRWSPRAFADRPVDAETINRLLEAARWAPSSSNSQPWRFIVATKDQAERYEQILACLAPANQVWAKSAPVLMIGCALTQFERNGKPNAWGRYDLGQSVAYLSLQATALGLFVHQMAGFDPQRVRETFALPETMDPSVAIAIGYLGDLQTLPEDFRKREEAIGERKSVPDLLLR